MRTEQAAAAAWTRQKKRLRSAFRDTMATVKQTGNFWSWQRLEDVEYARCASYAQTGTWAGRLTFCFFVCPMSFCSLMDKKDYVICQSRTWLRVLGRYTRALFFMPLIASRHDRWHRLLPDCRYFMHSRTLYRNSQGRSPCREAMYRAQSRDKAGVWHIYLRDGEQGVQFRPTQGRQGGSGRETGR